MPLSDESEALVARVTADWDMDPWGEYESARRRLEADLAAIEAAARADADPLRARVALLEGALADVLILGHIQDDGPSLCQCRIHQNARRALQPPAVTATETWGSHRFQPGASAPDKCLWTDGRWSACKAPGDAWCHTPAVTATGAGGEPCSTRMLCPYPQDHPVHDEDGDHPYTPPAIAPAVDEPLPGDRDYRPWVYHRCDRCQQFEEFCVCPMPAIAPAVERCPPGQHDWEVRHPGDLASCRRCWFVETDADHPIPTTERCACSVCPCSNPVEKSWRRCADCEAGGHVTGFAAVEP